MSVGTWVDELCRRERLPPAYAESVHEYVAPLAHKIFVRHKDAGRPIVVGICGAQGSGKTTFTLFLENWLQREFEARVATLSLDDIYLSKSAREELARTRHPLLATRGVPGTHDVALGMRLLDDLGSCEGTVTLPRFDKSADDRVAESDWRRVSAPVDIVLFEGWCVGVRPQPEHDLVEPANALEADHDADGSWRRYVNRRLQGDYALLFGRLDRLVLLSVPSFASVLEWRQLQEEKRRGSADPREIGRFVRHFERLTRHIQEDMPRYANTVIRIDERHRMVAMAHLDW